MITHYPSNRMTLRSGIFACALASLVFQIPLAVAEDGPPFRLGDPRLAAAMPSPMEASGFGRGKHLVLEVQRDFARPQDRWVDLVIDVSGLPEKLADYKLEATLSAVTESVDLGVLRFTPETKKILLQVDMRRADAPELWVVITATKDGKRVDGVQYRLRAEGPENPLKKGDTIPVNLDFPEESASAGPSPVVIGVPFAPGQLWDAARLSLQKADGSQHPFQHEATGTWIDGGSIQWVQFRTMAEPGANLVVAVDAGNAEKPPSAADAGLVSRASENQLFMMAGTNRLLIGKGLSPIAEVMGDGKLLAQSKGARGLYLVDSKGRVAHSAPDAEIKVEANGPLHACIRIEANYVTDSGEAVARHITRLESWKGKDSIAITHTLVLTGDTNELWFKEAGWEFSLPAENRQALQAVFSIDANQQAEVRKIPLNTETPAAFIFQESHPSIGGGKAVFRVSGVSGDRKESVMMEGASMGDWGGYRAGDHGMFWGIKDAARQHPKEIFVSLDKLNLLLFSNRAAEEMDFRTETLEKRWGVGGQLDAGQLKQFRAHVSNAVGWSKTHELLLLPVSKEVGNATIAAEAMRLRHPVYAIVDPSWIYQSRALGPLHPYDPERFPDAEILMSTVFEEYAGRVPGDRYNGFFDYHAGPHYGLNGRYRLTYTLLHDAWLYAARTGKREARQFAEGSNRAFRDNYINHWQSPAKDRGLFVDAAGGTGGWRKSDFPFYWEESTSPSIATTTSLMQFIWDYQFSGNRRSGEVVHNFADGLKAHWKPGMDIWRAFMVLRVCGQAWQFTNDPELLVLLEETANLSVYDPEGEFLMSRDNRPYKSSLYKTNTDVGTMIQLWELLGTQRWHEMSRRVAEYWWRNRAGFTPIFRISGTYLNFLYNEADSPAIAQNVDFNIRAANTWIHPETGNAAPVGFSSLDNIFQGIPYGMDVVARSGADKKPVASILQFDDYGNDSALFLKKAGTQRAVLYVQPPKHAPGLLKSRLTVEPLGELSAYGLDLVKIEQRSDAIPFDGAHAIKLTVAKDSPETVYRVTPELGGSQFAVAEGLIPLVFRCDGYWRPASVRPAARYYFQVPKDAKEPMIFLEAPTLLYQPDGKAWGEGKPVQGKVSLPAETPGLWSLAAVEPGLIRTRNIPPYFAMNSPEAWFNPDVEIKGDAMEGVSSRQLAAGDVPKGVLIGNGKGLNIEPAKGTPLFDHMQGTIEFFLKPEWSSFDLRDGNNSVIRRIFQVDTAQTPWNFLYRIDPLGTTMNLGPREPSHSFYAEFDTFAEGGRKHQVRTWQTRQILEAGEWVHVAMVWGPKERRGGRESYTAPGITIYINGHGQEYALGGAQTANQPANPVKALRFDRNLNAEIRQLRVSSTQRYLEDFAAPAPNQKLENDADAVLFLELDSGSKLDSNSEIKITR